MYRSCLALTKNPGDPAPMRVEPAIISFGESHHAIFSSFRQNRLEFFVHLVHAGQLAADSL
jgi:hypothetical protein